MAEPATAYPIAIMALHIGAGSIALAAGAGAMAFRKGGRLHRLSGQAFVLAMLVMGGFGSVIAVIGSERITAVVGLFAVYLVFTAWATARNRTGVPGRLDIAALAFGAAIALTFMTFGVLAALSPKGRLDSLPAPIAFLFAAVALLAVVTDLRRVLARGVSGPARVRRHIWRVSAAFYLATGSFFLGQQDEFPAAIQGPIWFVPAFAPLVLMIYWLWRYRNPKKRRPSDPGHARPAMEAVS